MGIQTDHRETSEKYHGELFRDGNFRVAVCRDGLQWLFQRQRSGKTSVGASWDTLAYCTSRSALNRHWTAKVGNPCLKLAALPPSIRRRAA